MNRDEGEADLAGLIASLQRPSPGSGPNHEGMLDILRQGFEAVPFNRFLGLKVVSLDPDDWCVRFERRDELVGNPVKGILHGGVISAVFDATGGLIVASRVLEETRGRPLEEVVERMVKVNTIDLRVDYLKPGRGSSFRVTGSVLRMGSAVCVLRMELRDDRDRTVSAATGTYKVC